MLRLLPFFAIAAMAALHAAPLPDFVQIRNSAHDELLRPLDASNKVGAPIVLHSAEPWKCMTWSVKPTKEGTVLVNVFSGKPFKVAGNGKSLEQAAGKDQIEWKIEALSEGFYRISDPASGLSLTGADGDEVHLEAWKDSSDQKWKLEGIRPSDLTM